MAHQGSVSCCLEGLKCKKKNTQFLLCSKVLKPNPDFISKPFAEALRAGLHVEAVAVWYPYFVFIKYKLCRMSPKRNNKDDTNCSMFAYGFI